MSLIKETKKNTLTNDEVIAIIKDFQDNGETYENEGKITALLSQYIGLIHFGASKYYPTFANDPKHTEEIEAAGIRGLFTAIRSYDCTRGALFQTWAYRFILNEIREYISTDVKHVTVYFYKNLRKVNGVIKEYEMSGQDYTDDDIIMRLEKEGLSEKSVRDCLSYIASEGSVSLDSYTMSDGDSVSLADSLTSDADDYKNPAEILEKREEEETLFDKMHNILDDEEFEIVYLYYVKKEKTKAIADMFDKDELTITRIVNAATTKLELTFGEMNKKDNSEDVSNVTFANFVFNDDDDDMDFESLMLG